MRQNERNRNAKTPTKAYSSVATNATIRYYRSICDVEERAAARGARKGTRTGGQTWPSKQGFGAIKFALQHFYRNQWHEWLNQARPNRWEGFKVQGMTLPTARDHHQSVVVFVGGARVFRLREFFFDAAVGPVFCSSWWSSTKHPTSSH